RGITLDRDAANLLALANAVHQFLVVGTDDLAEYRVLAIQPRAGDVRDEELAAVGRGAGIGHGQHATLVREPRVDFVLEAIARATCAGAAGAATLDHEVGNLPMKRQAVVEAAL